jgi:hypothetical protein
VWPKAPTGCASWLPRRRTWGAGVARHPGSGAPAIRVHCNPKLIRAKHILASAECALARRYGEMKFGPAEMSQMMDGAMSWITVMAVSSVGIGIILGLIVVVLYRNELVIGTTSSLLPSIYSFVVLVALVGGGILYYYSLRHSDSPADHQQVSARPSPPTNEPQQQVPSDFEATYKQLGIPSLPRGIERQQQIQNRLSQLSREACYIDAIDGLGKALLDAGYPREAATWSWPRPFPARRSTRLPSSSWTARISAKSPTGSSVRY